jgi:glycerate kinase
VGAASAAFLGAELRSGIATLLSLTHFDALVGEASLVITGEGRIDSQTLRGKVPYGVMRAAAQRGVPTLALGGSVADEAELLEAGFRAVAPITPEQMTLEEAMNPAVASRNLRNTTARLLSSLLYS